MGDLSRDREIQALKESLADLRARMDRLTERVERDESCVHEWGWTDPKTDTFVSGGTDFDTAEGWFKTKDGRWSMSRIWRPPPYMQRCRFCTAKRST